MRRDVFSVIDELANGLAELRDMLGPLAGLAGERRVASPRSARAKADGATSKGRGRRTRQIKPRRPVSAAVRASRKLQGQYLAAVRRLTKAQRTQVKRLLAKEGKQAAIKAAKGMQSSA